MRIPGRHAGGAARGGGALLQRPGLELACARERGVQPIPRAEGRAGGQAEPAGRPAGCVGRVRICERPYPPSAPAAGTSTSSSWLRVSHDASQVGTVP